MNLRRLILILAFSAMNAFGLDIDQNLQFDQANYRLLCHYTFERIETSELQTKTFVIYGHQLQSGEIVFSKTINSVSAYSFTFDRDAGIPTAKWHFNSKIRLDLKIAGSDIEFRYRFYNYTDGNKVETVFDETRGLYRPGLDYLKEASFNYFEGELIEGEVNQRMWVNERGVTLDKCRIDIY